MVSKLVYPEVYDYLKINIAVIMLLLHALCKHNMDNHANIA